jgi:cytochrome c oxidase assembly protein subunit 11
VNAFLQIAPYFSKVECFCFEEQKLLAGEEVDMPLLFFIDKDVLDDPSCRNVDSVVLSYTFFRYVYVVGEAEYDD